MAANSLRSPELEIPSARRSEAIRTAVYSIQRVCRGFALPVIAASSSRCTQVIYPEFVRVVCAYPDPEVIGSQEVIWLRPGERNGLFGGGHPLDA